MRPLFVRACCVRVRGAAFVADSSNSTRKLTPRGVVSSLDLKRPIYEKTAAYGHFGRELPEFTWESTPHKEVFAELASKHAGALVA